MATGLRRMAAIQAMAGLPRPARVLLAASGLSNIGSGLVLPFLVVYLHSSLGYDMLLVTSTYSVTAVLAVAGGLVAGHCVDRYGAGRTFAVFSVLSAAGTGGYAVVSQPWHALVAAGVFGLGIGGNAGFNSALAVAVAPEQRALAFGTNFALINAATAIGSVLGGLVVSAEHPTSFRVLYLLNAVSYLAAGAIVLRAHRWSRPAAPEAGAADRPGEHALALYLRLLRDRRLVVLLLITVVLYFVAYGQLESGLPALVITETELGPRSLSVIFAANTVVVVLAQLTLAHRIQRAKHTRALQLAATLWLISWVLIAVAVLFDGIAVPLAMIAAAVGVFAVAECLIGAALPATINAFAPDHLRGKYNAVNGITLSLGMALGPLAAGGLLRGGNEVPYLAVVLGGCALGALALVLFERMLLSGPNQVAQDGPGDAQDPARPGPSAAQLTPATRDVQDSEPKDGST